MQPTTNIRLMVCFREKPGQAGTKKVLFVDLNEARDDVVSGWQWHQPDPMQTIFTSLQTDSNVNSSIIYGLDAIS